MEFKTDVFSLDKPSKVKFDLVGAKLPNANDLYFRSKQHELVEQYSAARIFMHETETDEDKDFADDTDIPFQIAYAVSIHKAQGLEYDSVKVIITRAVDERITHNIFYTAITRSKKDLKIYWSPETQEKVINAFEISDSKKDASVFAAQTGLKMKKKV